MPRSIASESPLSTHSGLSNLYELVSSPFPSGPRDTTAETKEAAEYKDDDLYGTAEYEATVPRRTAARVASHPPSLQPVQRGSLVAREPLSLGGFSPYPPERKAATNTDPDNSHFSTNATSSAADDTKSMSFACSQHSEAESRSDRHRRYSQAVQTPLTDTASVTSFVRSIRQFSNNNNNSANAFSAAAAQSARPEAHRSASRQVAPVTINLAATARRPNGGRLEPLARSTGGGATSTTSAAAREGVEAPLSARREGRTCTSASLRPPPLSQAGLVTSAPTCLPSSLSGNRGGGARSSFLREPLYCSSGSHDGEAEGSAVGGKTTLATATAASFSLLRDGTVSPDSALLHQGMSAMPGESRQTSQPMLTRGGKESREETREVAQGSPAATTPHAVRIGASRSGSEVFSMHTLVTRSKNVDNFDYGLSALGFPVEHHRPQQQPQHPHRPGSVAPRSPGANQNQTGSFLVAASDAAGLDRAGGSGVLHRATPSSDVCGSMIGKQSTLPSLLVQKHSGLQGTAQPCSAAAAVADAPSSHASGCTGDVALSHEPQQRQDRQQLSTPLAQRTSERESSAVDAVADASQSSERRAPSSPLSSRYSPPKHSERSGDVAPRKGDGSAHVAGQHTASNSTRDASLRARPHDAPPPRPPQLSPRTSPRLASPDYAPRLRISGSPSLRSLKETKAGLGMTYDEAMAPMSLASNGGTLLSSNGSSGALTSLTLRSIVLQPRRLPGHTEALCDRRGESSNDFFLPPRRSDGGEGDGVSGDTSGRSGMSGSRAAPHQPPPGIETPDLLSPKLTKRKPGLREGSFNEVAGEIDRDALLAPAVSRNTDDEDEDEVDSLLYGDADESFNDADDGADPSLGDADGGLNDGAVVQTLLSPVRRDSKVARESTGGLHHHHHHHQYHQHCSMDSVRRYSTLSRDEAAEERHAARCSRETFLPFEEVTAVGSRGFSSLMLTSFLRHAGSTETMWTPTSSGVVWSPQHMLSISSSPPSSMAATVAGIPLGGSQRGSLLSQTSMPRASARKVTDEAPLPNVSVDGLADAQRGGRPGASLRGTAALYEAALRVPAPPRVASPRTMAKAPRSSVVSTDTNAGAVVSGAVAEPLPAELAQVGVLRWTKPLTAASVVSGAAFEASDGALSAPTADVLLRQLEVSNHSAWQDVRGLSILEHRTPEPSAATRVYAADNGYAIRVVQNDLMGDCEIDECVERCAASTTLTPKLADKSSAASPPLTLPSVLVDDAVRRFFEDGENAIAVVMDTAAEFAAQHSAPANSAVASPKKNTATTPLAGGAGTRSGALSTAAAAGGCSAPLCTAVPHAMCLKVVEAFVAFKAALAKTQPDAIPDLKMAVALVPVLPSTTPGTFAPPAAQQRVKAVFHDVVSRASTQQDSWRPLEIATSPIFGTCLNGCQWLVVEDASDLSAAFALLDGLSATRRGQQGFLYIQFLHQCFLPGVDDVTGNSAGTPTAASSGVAGFARRRNMVGRGGGGGGGGVGGGGTAPLTDARRNSRLSDIVVSSFTIACTHFPQVFEVLLDQRADTPWPLLRYALGKGPSTVLGVVRVHEEDEEAAYPLSLLQRMKSQQHPRPRRGSVRTFVSEQCTKMTDLKRRLAEAEDRAARAGPTAALRATVKRLSVLILKVACSTKDAAEFLFDPESAYVPVYVEANHLPARAATAADAMKTSASVDRLAAPPRPTPRSPLRQSSLSPLPPLRSSFAVKAEPLLLAMVQQYDALTDSVSKPEPSARKGTAMWTLSAKETPSANGDRGTRQRPQQLPHASPPRTLTAWLTLTKSVAFQVDEVTSLNVLNECDAQLPLCKTWHHLGARFHGGCNATAVVVQERQEGARLWSLRIALELVHTALKDTWSHRPSSTRSLSATPPSHAVMRVAVSVYHVSGSAVADLLRSSTTSRMITGTTAAGSVTFAPATLAVRPLTGAAVPLNVTSQPVESLQELETVLREAVERLRCAQNAVKAGTSSEGLAADLLARRSLTEPGYTVATVELTQRVLHDSKDGEEVNDVLVSALSVVDLGGHCGLLREATDASVVMEKGDGRFVATAAKDEKTQLGLPSVGAMLLARLLVKRRDLVVCAAALPSVPTATTAFGLLSMLKEFQQNASCAPHVHNTAAPGSVRRLVAHLQTLIDSEASRRSGATILANVEDALKQAEAVLRDPRRAAFVSYPYTQQDAEALELPAMSHLVVDASALRRSSLLQDSSVNAAHNNSSTVTTVGTVSTVGCSGSSPEVFTGPEGHLEKALTVAHPMQQDTLKASRSVEGVVTHLAKEGSPTAAAAAAATRSAITPSRARAMAEGKADRVAGGGTMASRDGGGAAAKSGTHNDQPTGLEKKPPAGYYGVHYGGDDAVLTQPDIQRFITPARFFFPDAEARAGQARLANECVRDTAADKEAELELQPVRMPSVLVLNASTTGAYVKRHGTRIRVPLPSSSGAPTVSYAADEVVSIRPSSTGMKSSLLMRAVSCVSHGRTAALLISDTESCDSTSCIAWLTLRTVMGGIFQSLKVREVEGVQHCATLRAFLIEEGRENEFADLLAPRLTAAQPRHALTRLKHSPFCGPVPADATARPVRDLQDVNAALSAVVAAARLAHQVSVTEPLRGAIALQLTFHQFVPATAAGEPADVIVSSLWCVQTGCCAGWMEALRTSPDSATASLLKYWMGGPCYTTSVMGLSRFTGVRVSTWKELVEAQRRLREVALRVPRPGSVQRYIASLEACVRSAAASCVSSAATRVTSAEERKDLTTETSSSSSAVSTPTKTDTVGGRREKDAGAASGDSLMRLTALLKEAQRLVGRGPGLSQSTQPPGQLAHEAKMFAALN